MALVVPCLCVWDASGWGGGSVQWLLGYCAAEVAAVGPVHCRSLTALCAPSSALLLLT